MTKHTPGPWRYVDGYLDCEVWAGNKMVLSYERHPTDEDRANARLMAAAPAMLEELRKIVEYHTTSKPWPEKEMDMFSWIASARAAIASATEAV